MQVREIFEEALTSDPGIGESVGRTLQRFLSATLPVIHMRKNSVLQRLPCLESYRIEHHLWTEGRKRGRVHPERVSDLFAVDIHRRRNWAGAS